MDRLTRGLDSTAVDQAFTRAKRALAGQAAVSPERLDATWAALAETLDADRMAGGEGWADDRPVDPRTRARQLLDAAGADGTSPRAVLTQLAAEGHTVPAPTLYGWWATDAVKLRNGAWIARHDDEEPR